MKKVRFDLGTVEERRVLDFRCYTQLETPVQFGMAGLDGPIPISDF